MDLAIADIKKILAKNKGISGIIRKRYEMVIHFMCDMEKRDPSQTRNSVTLSVAKGFE